MSKFNSSGADIPPTDGTDRVAVEGNGAVIDGNAGRLRLVGEVQHDPLAADPGGRAALLLVESLIHALVDKKLLTPGEAIDVIDIAIEVEDELALAANGAAATRKFTSPLAPIATTFRGQRRD